MRLQSQATVLQHLWRPGEKQMLLYCPVNCLCTAKQPGTVWSQWTMAPCLCLGCSYIHGYFGTPQCWGRYFESHSQRCCQLPFGWCQREPELSVPSAGKNSTRMHQVSLAQPGLKDSGLVRAASVTEQPTPSLDSAALWSGEEDGSDLQWWKLQGFHANNSLCCLKKYCLFWQQLGT